MRTLSNSTEFNHEGKKKKAKSHERSENVHYLLQ